MVFTNEPPLRAVREQNFSERDRRKQDKAFETESNAEMMLKEEFAKAQAEVRSPPSLPFLPRIWFANAAFLGFAEGRTVARCQERREHAEDGGRGRGDASVEEEQPDA